MLRKASVVVRIHEEKGNLLPSLFAVSRGGQWGSGLE